MEKEAEFDSVRETVVGGIEEVLSKAAHEARERGLLDSAEYKASLIGAIIECLSGVLILVVNEVKGRPYDLNDYPEFMSEMHTRVGLRMSRAFWDLVDAEVGRLIDFPPGEEEPHEEEQEEE